MKIFHWIILGLTIMAAVWFVYRTGESQSRADIPLDMNWSFIQGDQKGAEQVNYDDSDWRFVSVPHDWMIEYPVDKSNPSGNFGGYYPGGIGWYRRTIDLQEYRGHDRFYLLFEGVYMNADVFFNGTHLGNHVYGYSSFHYDVSELVRTDTVNILAVRTDCSRLPVDRWYSGAGIYRPVRLIATNDVHVPIWGTTVHSVLDEAGDAELHVAMEMKNHGRKSKRFEIRYDVVDSRGHLVAEANSSAFLKGGQLDTARKSFHIVAPELWSPSTPELYKINCYLMDGSEVIDHVVTRHGFRSARFDPDLGFVLNGEKLLLKGVNLHHDGGELGAAVPIESWKRRFEKLKLLGINAIRFAHNPHAPGVLDLCDEMGFLVIDELYDKWEMEFYHMARGIRMEELWEEEVENFVRRDRNHPSVILWSVGNETMEQLLDPEKGRLIYGRLIGKLQELDSTREVSCALHPGKVEDGHEVPSSLMPLSRVASYNYRSDSFAVWHERYPRQVFLAAETFPYNPYKTGQFEVIDFSDNSWNNMDEFVAGQFIWAGIDYLGESSGWPDRGFRHGLLWTNGFIKPYAWYVASKYRDDPMVKLTVKDPVLADSLNTVEGWQTKWMGPPLVDHWSFQDQPGSKEVVIFSNCDQVELYLNDSLHARLDRKNFADGVMKSELPFKQGRLVAKAFYDNEGGTQQWVSDTLVTAKRPYRLAMHSDRWQVSSSAQEVLHITTELRDSAGVVQPHSKHLVNYQVDGPGEIRVIDNGDLADHSLPGTTSRELRKGKQLLILQAGSEPGDLIISASALGMESSKIKIKTKK